MKRLIAPALILSVGLCCFTYVRAQNYTLAAEAREIERTPRGDITDIGGLTGLRYISKVVVENLDDDAKSGGLTEDLVRTAVELRLRAAGWKITGVSSAPGEYVYVNLNVLALTASGTRTGRYVLHTVLKVKQMSTLTRLHVGKTVDVFGPTWSRSHLGFCPKRSDVVPQVRELLTSMCDELLNDWYKVNPQ